jgi:hypothetical protein
MLSFRWFLVPCMVVLAVLQLGCQARPRGTGSDDPAVADPTPGEPASSASMKKKFEKLQKEPQGPSLQPPK